MSERERPIFKRATDARFVFSNGAAGVVFGGIGYVLIGESAVNSVSQGALFGVGLYTLDAFAPEIRKIVKTAVQRLKKK